MHVACVGICAGVKVGSCEPSSSVNRSVRRWQYLSEGLVQSPWKSPPRIMRWLGYVVVECVESQTSFRVFCYVLG